MNYCSRFRFPSCHDTVLLGRSGIRWWMPGDPPIGYIPVPTNFRGRVVAKMASHAIFQYNVLAIDDTHNTWTNICVKMIIIRLIGPRDEKIQNPEEIRSKGPRQR